MKSDATDAPVQRQHWAEFNHEMPTAINLFHKAFDHLRERTLISLPDDDVAGVVVSQNLVVLLDDLDSVLTLYSKNKITGAHIRKSRRMPPEADSNSYSLAATGLALAAFL
jgi:hypothetical protein